MRRFNVAAGAAALALAIAAGAGAQTPPPSVMPASGGMPAASSATAGSYVTGISIDVVLTAAITSETAQVGDNFGFKTTQDVKIGDLDVPAGTPGHGRLAVVVAAHGGQNGQLSLQADSIDLPAGPTVWVNIDTSVSPRGHYSQKGTKVLIIPLPIGIVPVFTSKVSGNLILDAGTSFRVVTILPRKTPAPLLTAPPTPPPAMPAASAMPGASVMPAGSAMPAALPSAVPTPT